MIHELIDPKKTNRSGASKNLKTYQESKTVPEEIRLEGSDSENKGSSSTIFIPPWLRNSLGLNQRNNLSHATTGSELKPSKQTQREKEPDQNETVAFKTNCEQNCCKKAIEHFDISQQDRPQEVIVGRTLDDAEVAENGSERGIPVYWDMRRKELENEWSYADLKPLTKGATQMAEADAVSLEMEKLKDEDKKILKFSKQKSKLKKRLLGDSKRPDLERDDVDLLLQMKARQALDNCMKADIDSEMKQLEEKLLLLGAKSHALSVSKPTEQDLRLLQELKKQLGNVEDLENVFRHIKDFSLRTMGNTDFQLKLIKERKRGEKEDKCSQKDGEKLKPEQESPPSTDDEDDIKRFSEFLSKNKDLEEKKKCLEEVRNYFERKRKLRMTKHRYLEEAKVKAITEPEGGEDNNKDKQKLHETCRGKRSKFALCGEEVVEKAVDEALHKFVELYHFRVTPSERGSMKKNILQALTPEFNNPSQGPRLLEMGDKVTEKSDTRSIQKSNNTDIEPKEPSPHKELRRRSTRTSNSREQLPRLTSVMNVIEDEKLKRLRREFDLFLNTIRGNIDVTSLKIQSIILEKEDKTAKNVQLVYNFTKKSLESNRTLQALKEPSDPKHLNDRETQTIPTQEHFKRNVKIQAGEIKNSLERHVQTDAMSCVAQVTQTEGMSLREVKELKSCDVCPGLYRMVRSKEAGKFYLYPESMEHGHRLICGDSNYSILTEKNMENADLKNKVREVQKTKLHKTRKVPGLGITHLRGSPLRKGREASENSISCLYFRNMDQKVSRSSSKKDMELTDENLTGVAEEAEFTNLKGRKKKHLGCFWFWNGEKIAAGCDLKTHVENLLQEKLTEIVNSGAQPNELMIGVSKDESSQELTSKAPGGVRISDALYCVNNARENIAGNNLLFSGNDNSYERKRRVKDEKINDEQGALSIFQDESGKNEETSSSQLKYVSVNMSKLKSQIGTGTALKKKCTKRNLLVKPAHRRVANLKKTEDFLRAVEEIKKIKKEFSNPKRGNTSESDSLLDDSSSSSGNKNEVEGPLSVVLGPEIDDITNSDIKKRLKRLISLVDRQVQTIATLEPRNGNSTESQEGGTTDGRRHLDLIGNVMSKVSQKDREALWNDIRNFIKTKIGKDINEEGTQEVCIEIEQDVPESEKAAKHSVMAKGHYGKNEGDVEVEIDLTLEDLARILHQRQRKKRRRHLFHTGRSKNFLSSSSANSDLKHQKYQDRFGALGESLAQDKESKPLKSKGN